MSGGHYNYLYSTIEHTYSREFEFFELEEMFRDFIKVLKDLEWYRSDDISQEDYHETAEKFIKKWLVSAEAEKLKRLNKFNKQMQDVIKTLREVNI